jgi:hypothetical protein
MDVICIWLLGCSLLTYICSHQYHKIESGVIKGISYVMFMCYQQCYVNAHFNESKGGIHQVNQLLAGIHSVECQCSTTANTESAEDTNQTSLYKKSQHSSVKCGQRCTIAWTAQRSHWTFWISETFFLYMVCISYLCIKHAPNNTRLKSWP